MSHSKGNKRVWRHRAHTAIQVILDIVMINLSFLAAMYLRYEKVVPVSIMDRYINIWPVLTLCCLAGLAVTRTYRSLWRYASIGEVMRVLGGTLGAWGPPTCSPSSLPPFNGPIPKSPLWSTCWAW